ncbi:MAG: hypothetical protein HYZ25_13715 [Chloroflexi bacterium]|nr:hypothetical protein [Chloroflexota bacterium]
MKTKSLPLILILLTALTLSACGSSQAEETPTLSVEDLQTAAVGTFQAVQTQTALAAPTMTPPPSPTVTPTFALLPTLPLNTQAVNTPVVATTASCNKLLYISDVTIPDNTAVNPGQTFTKTWRVQNSGSCAWAAGYKFSLVGGDAMGGQTVTLTASVAPGSSYDISVPMTAPSKAGKLTGSWRMSDASGVYFGDMLTVVVVVGSTTGTAAPTATNTPVTPAYP